MPKEEHNKKLPEIDAQKEKFEFTYPYFTCDQDDNGKFHFTYHDPNNPKNSTHFEMDHNGGYRATMPDDGASKGKGIHVAMTPGHTAEYSAGGSSSHTDGHSDSFTGETHQTIVSGDMQNQTGGSMFAGAADKIMQLAQDMFKHAGAAGAASKEYVASKGDVVEQHSGNKHTDLEGDDIKSIAGNKHVMIKNGEHAIHVQNGNMDTKVDKGRYQVYASDTITIESKTRIIINVGKSYIDISPKGIEIGSDGFINLYVNKGKDNLTIANYGSGRVQLGAGSGSAVVAGNDVIIKSKTGTTIEKGPAIPPLPWPGLPPK